MPVVQTSTYNRVLELLPALYKEFCRLYRQKLIARQKEHTFRPDLWWGDPRRSRVWTDGALFMLDKQEPWKEYLGWLFEENMARTRMRLPGPQALSSLKTWLSFVRDYNSPPYQQALEQRLRQELEYQKSQLLIGWVEAQALCGLPQQVHDGTREGAQRYVLLSSRDMTALFRYCVACQEGLVDVADICRRQAQQQYSLYAPLYDQVWQDLLPGGEFQLKGVS